MRNVMGHMFEHGYWMTIANLKRSCSETNTKTKIIEMRNRTRFMVNDNTDIDLCMKFVGVKDAILLDDLSLKDTVLINIDDISNIR